MSELPDALDDDELPPDEGAEEFDGLDDEPITEEERAKAMGWKPRPADPRNPQRDEYHGDLRHWTDAATFIARGERELPILRDQNRRLTEKVAVLERNQVQQAQAVKDAMALARRADEQGYSRAKAELEARRIDAVESGDTVVFNQVDEELRALEAARATAPADPPPAGDPPPAAPPPQDARVAAFVRDTAWFGDTSRPYLRDAMIAFHKEAIAKNPGVPEGELIDDALDRMRGAYPALFEDPMDEPTPRPRRAATVSTPSPPLRPRRAGANPFDAITDPAERAEAERAFRNIQRSDPGMTAAEYMNIYSNPRADAIELRQQRSK